MRAGLSRCRLDPGEPSEQGAPVAGGAALQDDLQLAGVAQDPHGALEHLLAQPAQAPAVARGPLQAVAQHVEDLVGERPEGQQRLAAGEGLLLRRLAAAGTGQRLAQDVFELMEWTATSLLCFFEGTKRKPGTRKEVAR